MKPFDIELAKQGHPIQTRDGRPVRIICYDRKSHLGIYPIIALVPMKEDREDIIYYTKKGIYSNTGKQTGLDLFMTTTKKEAWVNLYKNKSGGLTVGGYLYDSEQKAINGGWEEDYFTTAKIEWRELQQIN